MTANVPIGLRSNRRQAEGGSLRAPITSEPWHATIDLSIAGLQFRLFGLPDHAVQVLRKRFQLFVTTTQKTVEPDLAIRILPAVVKGYLDYERQGGSTLYRLETRAQAGRLHAWSYAFAGWFDVHGTSGELNLCDSPIEPFERSIENFLRVALAWKAASREAFLIHASGLVRDGKAYLFFGPSGSGKTTVTRLSPNDILLNDDCMLIARENGSFVARGVPFKGSEVGGAQDARPFPIAGLFRLVKSRKVFCEPIAPVRAVAEIAASVPFVSERPEGLEACFGAIEALARAVPIARLHFRLAPDFWEPIEEAARG